MRSLVALTLVLAVASGDMMMMKKIHQDMAMMNSQAMCWGQGNMMYYKMAMMNALEECMGGHTSNTKPSSPFAQLNKPSNPFQTLPAQIQAKNPFSGNQFKKARVNPDSLKSILFSNFDSRRKRQADGLIEVTEEDFAEFLGDFSDFKDDVASKMSNLTCVLSKMNMLDSNYQVNLKAYTEDFWKDADLSQSLAGEDPVWRQMMIDGYTDCYDIAKSFPQSALNKNPIMKVFGRHMVFFKCTKKVEAHCCGMACANHMLETMYGNTDNFDWSQYGLPNNKYERAAMSMKVMYGTASPEEEFVHNFLYMDPMM
jgi:hypothetical protein